MHGASTFQHLNNNFMDFGAELFQWIYVAILAPVLGWFGGGLNAWHRERRRKKQLVRRLSGMPSEAKAEIVNFHYHRAHTLRGNPTLPAIRLLVGDGIIRVKSGGGSYDAVDRYLTVHPDIWEVMDDWVSADAEAEAIVRQLEFPEEPAQLQSPPEN